MFGQHNYENSFLGFIYSTIFLLFAELLPQLKNAHIPEIILQSFQLLGYLVTITTGIITIHYKVFKHLKK